MSNLKRIYILSWFGNDSIRDKRKEYHRQQIEWARQNNLDIFVFPQGYNKEDYVEGVNYLDNPNTHILFPANARNYMLKHFYASDCDYAIIADNDSILHSGEQHCDSKDFVEKFNNISLSSLEEIDFFFPINPAKMPFSKTYREQKDQFDKNLIFTRNIDAKGSFAVLKNMKKFFNVEFYYDEKNFVTVDGKMIAGEDQDFGINLLNNGYGCYMCNNIVLKEFGHAASTWSNNRGDEMKKSRQILISKYGIEMSASGRMKYNSVYAKSSRNKKAVISKTTALCK